MDDRAADADRTVARRCEPARCGDVARRCEPARCRDVALIEESGDVLSSVTSSANESSGPNWGGCGRLPVSPSPRLPASLSPIGVNASLVYKERLIHIFSKAVLSPHLAADSERSVESLTTQCPPPTASPANRSRAQDHLGPALDLQHRRRWRTNAVQRVTNGEPLCEQPRTIPGMPRHKAAEDAGRVTEGTRDREV